MLNRFKMLKYRIQRARPIFAFQLLECIDPGLNRLQALIIDLYIFKIGPKCINCILYPKCCLGNFFYF